MKNEINNNTQKTDQSITSKGKKNTDVREKNYCLIIEHKSSKRID